jgi:aminotransferase
LRTAFNEKTKAIILTNPHNPTGKVFTMQELRFIANLCIEYDALALTDEIYEHILYPDLARDVRHIAIATLDGMRERTVTINSLSKTYSVTGWRVGFAIAPPEITNAIRQVHDFLTVGAASPLQEAGVFALNLPQIYYEDLQLAYKRRRDYLLGVLEEVGFRCFKPDGAYYIMTDISGFGFPNDFEFSKYLISEIGVAVVPGSSFYSHPELGEQQVRFCYCKRDETLQAASERLQKLKG